jgi:hypothetical protein
MFPLIGTVPHPVICWLWLIAVPMVKNQPELAEIA